LASTLGPSTALGSLHDGKGVCLSRLERFSEAEKSFNQALEIFGAAGHREGQAAALGNLGVQRYRQGKLDEALEHINKARHLYLAIGDTVIAAVCRSNTGDVLFEQGKFGSARKEFEDALVTFKRTRSQDYRSAALQSLIACLKKLGDSQEERKRTLELEELSNA
ncbi:MAG: tetratricopeptide repeat protein, partial [Deltaproteobacteria bacterium]|nr:tetratricopeptide repeat protein [Deltaproteobacteria bacterium]